MEDKIPPCTTVKQSRLLVQVGIDPNTADMVYYFDHGELFLPSAHLISSRSKHDIPDWNSDTFLPAWSFVALLNLLPETLLYDTDDEGFTADGYDLIIKGQGNRISYRDGDKSVFDSGNQLNLLNAAVETVVWLARDLAWFDPQ